MNMFDFLYTTETCIGVAAVAFSIYVYNFVSACCKPIVVYNNNQKNVRLADCCSYCYIFIVIVQCNSGSLQVSK